ncbi:MAG: GGDEF domain-containing protein [Solirubrobacteraceae bacterium]|nr:GGDEF domain-containing protein [Solirubrobacteraceae bacterium]
MARVSRRELALNRYVWLSTGGMFLVFALATAVIAFLPLDVTRTHLLIFAGILLAVSLTLLRTEPPAIGTIENHIVLACVYVGTAGGMVAFHPGGSAAIGAAMFVGPLTAVRLIDRREITAHYLAATAFLLLPALTGIVDRATVLACLTVIPAMWVLGGTVVVVLEAAEAQGEELEHLVRRDPLTGVGNRRLLSEKLTEEIARHGRVRRPLSVIALDLNGFKALNDTVGHAAGDDLLRDVARALERVARKQDIVVRQGGDEFCVILPDTPFASAESMGNAIRAELAKIDLHGAAVSTGIGVASFPKDAVHGGVLLHVADERLRENKAQMPPAAIPKVDPSDIAGISIYRSA